MYTYVWICMYKLFRNFITCVSVISSSLINALLVNSLLSLSMRVSLNREFKMAAHSFWRNTYNSLNAVSIVSSETVLELTYTVQIQCMKIHQLSLLPLLLLRWPPPPQLRINSHPIITTIITTTTTNTTTCNNTISTEYTITTEAAMVLLPKAKQ